MFDNIVKYIPEQIEVGNSVTIDGEKEIRLDLSKLKELKSCYLRWGGTDPLYLNISSFLTDPLSEDNTIVVEIPPQNFISVSDMGLRMHPQLSKIVATSASVGQLTLAEFGTDPQNNAILLEAAENVTVGDNSSIYCIGGKRTEGLSLKFTTS